VTYFLPWGRRKGWSVQHSKVTFSQSNVLARKVKKILEAFREAGCQIGRFLYLTFTENLVAQKSLQKYFVN
jgi:hypothetical protein